MGIGPNRDSCCVSFLPKENFGKHTLDSRNPDPSNFKILRMHQFGNYTIAEILYPNCTNFEGKKIAVYKTSMKNLSKAKSLDPHFMKNSELSPIARFIPTDEGWSMANEFIEMINVK